MLTEAMIKLGIDRNILVYDMEAPAGIFTLRLFTLIQSCVFRNLKSPLKRIYLSPDNLHDVYSWKIPPEWRVEYYQDGFFAGLHKRILDKEFIPHTGLGSYYDGATQEFKVGNYQTVYHNHGGCIGSDVSLIVCQSVDGEIILASC